MVNNYYHYVGIHLTIGNIVPLLQSWYQHKEMYRPDSVGYAQTHTSVCLTRNRSCLVTGCYWEQNPSMHSNTYMHIIPASLDPRPFPPLVLQTAKTGSGNGLGMRLGSKTLRFRVYWELVVIVEHSNVVTVVHVWLSRAQSLHWLPCLLCTRCTALILSVWHCPREGRYDILCCGVEPVSSHSFIDSSVDLPIHSLHPSLCPPVQYPSVRPFVPVYLLCSLIPRPFSS